MLTGSRMLSEIPAWFSETHREVANGHVHIAIDIARFVEPRLSRSGSTRWHDAQGDAAHARRRIHPDAGRTRLAGSGNRERRRHPLAGARSSPTCAPWRARWRSSPRRDDRRHRSGDSMNPITFLAHACAPGARHHAARNDRSRGARGIRRRRPAHLRTPSGRPVRDPSSASGSGTRTRVARGRSRHPAVERLRATSSIPMSAGTRSSPSSMRRSSWARRSSWPTGSIPTTRASPSCSRATASSAAAAFAWRSSSCRTAAFATSRRRCASSRPAVPTMRACCSMRCTSTVREACRPTSRAFRRRASCSRSFAMPLMAWRQDGRCAAAAKREARACLPAPETFRCSRSWTRCPRAARSSTKSRAPTWHGRSPVDKALAAPTTRSASWRPTRTTIASAVRRNA